jgi:hypothetical protein
MKLRSLHWNLVAWHPSAGPADPFGAPGLTYIAWQVRARWRCLFLIVGALLMVAGLMLLHSTVAFIAGVLLVALSAGTEGTRSPTAAMVRTWRWLHSSSSHANHR